MRGEAIVVRGVAGGLRTRPRLSIKAALRVRLKLYDVIEDADVQDAAAISH